MADAQPLSGRSLDRLEAAAAALERATRCDVVPIDVGDAESVHLGAGGGRVVNVASTAGLAGYPYVSAYCAAKHGVIGLTRALAAEYAQRAVTFNAVCPGYADTDMTRRTVANIVARTGRTQSEARAALTARNPQRRLIAPGEVAAAVAWLCLPESSAVNGQAISVSGGEVMAG